MARTDLTTTLKLASSLDGKIALSNRQSQWITGEHSRAQVHRMRATHDAIVTAIGTVLADDPKMTARPEGTLIGEQPLRVILDTRLVTPPDSQLFKCDGKVLIYAGEHHPERQSGLEAAGAEIAFLSADSAGHLDLNDVLSDLASRGVKSVMVEGGAELAGAFIRADLVDKIEWFRAPRFIGGDGLPVISALGLEQLSDTPMFERQSVRELGTDVWETYHRVNA